jgi:cyd operon protein YbgT
MWYFAWILGVLLACAFGIINVMWLESEHCLGDEEDSVANKPRPARVAASAGKPRRPPKGRR